MQEIQVNCPYKWQRDCANITDVILAIIYVLRTLFAYLSWPVVNYWIKKQQFVQLHEEAVENHVASKEEIAPLYCVFLAEFVKDEDWRCDALPSNHGQKLIQELVFDRLNQYNKEDKHLNAPNDWYCSLYCEKAKVNVYLMNILLL